MILKELDQKKFHEDREIHFAVEEKEAGDDDW